MASSAYHTAVGVPQSAQREEHGRRRRPMPPPQASGRGVHRAAHCFSRHLPFAALPGPVKKPKHSRDIPNRRALNLPRSCPWVQMAA